MDCKGIGNCTYMGPAEVGRFGFNRFYAKQVFIRCPRCKHIFPREDDLDTMRRELRFRSTCSGTEGGIHPLKRKKMTITELDGWGLAKYIIFCPHCHRGTHGVLVLEELKEAMRYAKKYKITEVEFPEVRCWICQHKRVVERCRFYVMGLVGACKGRKAEMEFEHSF